MWVLVNQVRTSSLRTTRASK